MLRVLFLLLFVTSFIALSYAAKIDSPLVFDEVFKLNKSNLKNATEKFVKALKKDDQIHGIIVNYGTRKQNAGREKIIRDYIAFRKFDASRITIGNSEQVDEEKTRFYLAPIEKTPNLNEEKR
ncbi:MAG TPA: hypothetical protein VF692_11455 [Pyrinomonadaceae bacterium]